MEASFELFDHTADIGIRVRAAAMPGLVAPATEGLYAVIGEVMAGDEADSVSFDLRDGAPPELLRDYLAELLVLFERDARRVILLDDPRFDERGLKVTARTANVDRARSDLIREVKAVTYHELEIRAIAGGYEATIIVDI
ncbi:MAG: archease [Phycisphaerae bacterium]|jgi:SHS2 domain-containing protein